MTLKNFYSNFNLKIENSLDKKILTKTIYGKFLVRNCLFESNPLYVLDNNNSFFNISSFKLNKFVKSSADDLSGNSLLAKEFEYKNKLNKSLTINNFLVKNTSVTKSSLINSFYSTLQVTRKRYLSSLLILNPIKGGFICYSSGVTGFLPRSHATFAFSKIFLILKQKSLKTTSVPNLNFLINTKNKIKDFLVVRLSNWWGKITLFPRIKKNRFSKLSRRKKRFFSKNINFVFLTNKNPYKIHKKKNYETKKI